MSYGAVFRVVRFHPDGDWVSRPYETMGAARNQASRKNKISRQRAFDHGVVPTRYEVQVLEGDWEPAE